MNSEQQQQRIMGYFIEEAREHLQTIEQGVLNLQEILDEPESINELFRAAHSIKGGAAMLGVGSVQHVAHRLEDFFKILKENPQIKVDERLKSLLLAGFDPLAELLDELQSGFKVSDELTLETNNRVKPVFEELESYLNQLASNPRDSKSSESSINEVAALLDDSMLDSSQESVFQEEVTVKMRDMLHLFRGNDSQESRSQLQFICNYFQDIGNKFKLSNWTNLATQTKNAITQPSNSYRTLAPIVIREFKEAQDLILANREAEISISSQIQNLLPYQFSVSEDDEISKIFTTAFTNVADEPEVVDLQGVEKIVDINSDKDLDVSLTEQVDQQSANVDTVDLFADDSNEETFDLLGVTQDQIDQMDWMDSEYEITENQHIDGPKVGALELKSLAVLFENDDIDFDAAWEDIESNESHMSSHSAEELINHNHDEFADLLENDSDNSVISVQNNLGVATSTIEQLFGDFPADESVVRASQLSQDLFPDDIDFLEDINLVEIDITPQSSPQSNPIIEINNIQPDSNNIASNSILDTSIDEDLSNFDLGIDIINISDNDNIINIDDININDENEDKVDFLEGLQMDSSYQSIDNQLFNEPIVERTNIESLSSEEYFSELERQKKAIPNSLEKMSESSEAFALTFPEENIALLEDPFAIGENLAKELLESPLSLTNQGLDTTDLNIFDELGFDDDESVVEDFRASEDSSRNTVTDRIDVPNVYILDDLDNHLDNDNLSSLDDNLEFDNLEFGDLSAPVNESDDFLSTSLESNNNPKDIESEFKGFEGFTEPESFDNISAQEINDVDESGDFFANSKEVKLIPHSSDLNNNDGLEYFSGNAESEGNDITQGNVVNSFEQDFNSVTNTDGLDDFFASSGITDNLSEDFFDDNWSDININEEELNVKSTSDNNFDKFPDSRLSQEINSDLGDVIAGVITCSNFPKHFEDITSLEESVDIEDLLANTNEDDLTNTENSFDNNFEFDEMRSLTESQASRELDQLLNQENEDLENLFATDNLSEPEIQQMDKNLTTTQDSLGLDDFVNNDDITASTTIDNLVDFFQADDDLDNVELVPSQSLINDDFEIDETSDLASLDEFISLNSSRSEMSGMPDINNNGITQISYIEEHSEAGKLNNIDDDFDFGDLEAMIGDSSLLHDSNESNQSMNNSFSNGDGQQLANSEDTDFDELEALLRDSSDFDNLGTDNFGVSTSDSQAGTLTAFIAPSKPIDDFDELENMLQSAFAKDVGPIKTKPSIRPVSTQRKQKLSDSTMRVDVKYLDSLNNLVGELVVNRNLLEQEQERLQQFLTNLLHQVQLLSDVSQRMRDQFDRSLLEASLTAGRGRSHNNSSFEIDYSNDGVTSISNVSSEFEGIEFDRYNTFHVLSQEIIELIVKVRESASDIEFVVGETDHVTRQLGTITTQVQDDLKQSRMVPFAQIADRLPRGIRDRALKSGKQADLEVYGRETLIDKAILESLTDPLTHLVNNAIDHGLEDPATRQLAGKGSTGKLTVRAYHQGNQTVISISDDGAGISTEKVKKSAVAKGVRTQAEVDRLNDTEVYALLFEAGFSTATEADEFKGRGVGLDVVKTCLDDIRGIIIVESLVGKGTTFTIRLPLTLSISKAMFCISDRARIAFPVDGFEDMVEVPQSQIILNEKGQPCLPWRDTVLPFQHLSNLLSYSRHLSRSNIYGKQEDDELCIIILRNDTNYLALQVDQFLGEYEIVIKQLEGPIPQPTGIAGATVLGDGRVMAIANVLELFDIASGRLRPSTSGITIQPMVEEDVAVDPTVLIVDDSITVRELLSLTFAKVGYRVEQAKDGQDAWEKLRAGLPCDMIFCDIEMPRMDGLDLLSRLQKDSRLKEIPVAMLTSRGADRHRKSAIQLGAKGYFTKPYLEEELLSASKRLLNGETLPI